MGSTSPSYSYVSVTNVKRNLQPGTVVVTWSTGGQQYTLTDAGDGTLTGDGSGEVSYATGQLFLNPSPVPAPGDGDYSIDYQEWQGTTKATATAPLNVGGSTTYAAGVAMREGSVAVRLTLKRISERWDYADVEGRADRIEYSSYGVTLTDDGNGNLRRNRGGSVIGTVNYATGELTFDPKGSNSYALHEETAYRNYANSWTDRIGYGNEEYASTDATIEWTDPLDPANTQTAIRAIPGLTVDLTPDSNRSIAPNSVIFTIGGVEYRDQDGAIIKNWSPVTDGGETVGSIDYSSGEATINDFPAGVSTGNAINLIACLTVINQAPANTTIFRTAGAPLREGSLIVNATNIAGDQITGNADTAGNITGEGIDSGFVDTQTGLVKIQWREEDSSASEPVLPASVRYSAVSFTFLPLDASLVGLDATRLPSDGRVPQFNRGDVAVVTNTQSQELMTATAGQVITLTRQNQAEVYIEGANGNRLAAAQFTIDTDAGTLTFADPLSLVDEEVNAVTEPLQVFDRVEDMGLITDVQIGGQLSINIPLSQNYTAGDTLVSAAALYGDIRARAHNTFFQQSFDGSTWTDELVGNSTTAKYNLVSNPIEITNQGAIQERWAIRFTSSTSFEVIGETVGVVATGNATADLAPTNQATGAPYFTIRSDGWGTGWVSGNTLRFNTDGGQAPFWVARTIVAGRAVEETDQFATQNRGDAD
jgi:hypothetical protein